MYSSYAKFILRGRLGGLSATDIFMRSVSGTAT